MAKHRMTRSYYLWRILNFSTFSNRIVLLLVAWLDQDNSALVQLYNLLRGTLRVDYVNCSCVIFVGL